MKIYSLLAAGQYHPIHGEDYQYYQYLGERWFVAAVMDGCSSGKESYFASTFYGKSLRKSCRMLPNMKSISEDFDIEFMDKEAIGSFILGQLFEDIKKLKNTLFLDIEEILSTILLLVYDVKERSAWINTSGDGIIVCDDFIEEIDQQNIPDYLGYHLDVKFDKWYQEHTNTYNFNHIKDISISTDGVAKIKPNTLIKSAPLDPVDYFLVQPPEGPPERALYSKYMGMVENHRYIAYDDISIIRIIP